MKTCLSILILCVSGWVTAQNPAAWEFKSERDGIKVYHQRTPGLLHIKLATSMKSSLSGIAALFADVDHYLDWGYKISEVRLLRRDSPSEFWYYAKYDFPWPVSDRDIILHSKLTQDPASHTLSIVNTPYPSYLPENKGVVRIQNTTTRWTIKPGEGGWVWVEQQISTDSAEGLPDWLVEMNSDTGPRETAKAIRRILSGGKYQDTQLAHIKN